MRSRYAAYATGDAAYLFRTWHPRTRPQNVKIDDDIVWRTLEVIDTTAGGLDDERGEVEFTAHYRESGHDEAMHERSRFERRAGKWVYVDGE